MSESEIKRRRDYKRNRKIWIAIQSIALVLVIAVALGTFLVYYDMNQTFYIEYIESGNVNYSVQYKENEFFEDEWVGPGQSYISSLVKGVKTDFYYKLDMDTASVAFDYAYDVVARLVISDKTTGHVIYEPADVVLPNQTLNLSATDSFVINESVTVDFAKYNVAARDFINAYGLSNAEAKLVVDMNVSVQSQSVEFEYTNSNTYLASLSLPLGRENFSIAATTGLGSGESKVLACKGTVNQNTFRNISIAAGMLALVLALILIIFIFATRNEDVNYTIKVKKLLRAYRSFINRIDGDFDSEGYQLVPVMSFVEMLGIRDTIQAPVLMSENKDQTKTQFLIPTNTKLLYVFEIKIDNYDEIYANAADVTESEGEAKAIEEQKAFFEEETAPVVSECVEPETESVEIVPVATTESETYEKSDAGESEESIVFYDENNNKLDIKCRRSLLANLIQSENDGVKAYYSELKNYILSYKGVKARISWRCETYTKGRQQLFKLKIRGKTICLYCALNPAEFDTARYFHKEVSAKAFSQVPMLIKIKSDRGLKRAKKLVDILMEKSGIAPDGKFAPTDYVAELPYEHTQALIDRGLIKILVPDGYVVVDPHRIASASSIINNEEKEEESSELIIEVNDTPADDDIEENDGAELMEIYDENHNKLKIQCRRSFLANLIQSESTRVKAYYSELKNYILSHKGVKARISWRCETYTKGRQQLFKLKIRGKTICLYCALNPSEFDAARYFHQEVSAKSFSQVPMLIKIRSDRGLKRAKKLVDLLMEKNGIAVNEKYKALDFAEAYPYETSEALVEKNLIKIN